MKQTRSLALLLTALMLMVTSVAAQSGRTRPDPSAKPANSPSPSPSESDDIVNQPGRNVLGNTQGEVIEGDVLRINTSLVTVPVSVVDRYGKYVPTMRRQDFHIFDEGVEQKIAYFASVDQPFAVVLVIDTSGSTHFQLEEIQDAAIAFVNQLQSQDRVMVMSFDDQIRVLCEPTNDREALAKAIRRTRTGGGTRLYDAVDLVIGQKLSHISGRKAVVLFTDGVDTTSRHATYSSTLKEAQESEGGIYTVAYDTAGDNPLGTGQRIPYPTGRGGTGFPFPGSGGRGGGMPGSSPGDYRRASDYLHELAQESGGRYFRGDTLRDISAPAIQPRLLPNTGRSTGSTAANQSSH
jgi:Ca-activated chloride channel family protein